MKRLITGQAGFIGFHVAKRMSELGHFVEGFDNFNEYYDPNLKLKRAKILSDDYNIMTHNIDLKNIVHVRNAVSNSLYRVEPREKPHSWNFSKPDLVIHLAAMAGVRYSMDHADEYILNNALGTYNLIRCLEEEDIQNVIYASTSCVMHGNPLPWGEPEVLYPQINPYGYTKYINESQFHISKIPNAMGLRFFTVYGPWGRPDMALFDFTKNILAGNPITLFNNGDMLRDFTYIDDIVHGIECVINNMTPRDMYSIGRGEVIELMRFVNAIETSLGVEAKLEYADKHPADAHATASDTTKLERLGYNPKTSIEEGVDNFVKWYRKLYN
jgi:UDP-glucuronate 4-epimerase